MHVIPYEARHRAQWDAFVAAHPAASIGHLSATFELEAVRGVINRSVLLLDGERVVAVLPMFEATSTELRFFHVRRLGSISLFLGGPLLAHTLPAKQHKAALATLMAGVEDLAATLRAHEVYIGYPAVIEGQTAIDRLGYLPVKAFGYSELNGVGLLLRLDQSEAALLQQLSSSCRNMVRRAEREGLVFEIITDRATWLGCHPLNVETLGDMAYSLPFFERVWDELIVPGHAVVGAAMLDGKIASVVVATTVGASSYYWMGFNPRPQLAPGANNFALWKMMLHCKQRGATTFELGSMEFGGSKQTSISAFKESFGGTPFYALSGRRVTRPVARAALDLLAAVAERLREVRARRSVAAAPAAAPPLGSATRAPDAADVGAAEPAKARS